MHEEDEVDKAGGRHVGRRRRGWEARRQSEDVARERVGEGAEERGGERESRRHINSSHEIRERAWARVWTWGVGT